MICCENIMNVTLHFKYRESVQVKDNNYIMNLHYNTQNVYNVIHFCKKCTILYTFCKYVHILCYVSLHCWYNLNLNLNNQSFELRGNREWIIIGCWEDKGGLTAFIFLVNLQLFKNS